MSMDTGTHFALEMQGLSKMKATANMDQGKGLKAASKQFEALFLHQMLKTMRDSVPKSGMLDSQATDTYTEMYDAQLAQVMAGKGVGLAELIEKHLSQRGLIKEGGNEHRENLLTGIPAAQPKTLNGMIDRLGSRPAEGVVASNPFSSGNDQMPAHVRAFVNKYEGSARLASNVSGVPSELIMAQAALETGWGKSTIKTEDGKESHNLFGIKAGKYWTGKTTDITTTEFVDGKAVKQVDTFRAYSSVTEGFADYARLVGKSPRYQSVVNAADSRSAAHAIQAAGYATDPSYANKLIAIIDQMGYQQDIRQAALDGEKLHRELW